MLASPDPSNDTGLPCPSQWIAGKIAAILGTFLFPAHPIEEAVPRRRMIRMPRNSGLIPNLLLATLLLSAQFGSLLHAFEHDPGAPQGKVCSTCATANQLSTACVDTHGDNPLVPSASRYLAEHDTGWRSTSAILVHQRGPPLLL
jgi:hypothetical protein